MFFVAFGCCFLCFLFFFSCGWLRGYAAHSAVLLTMAKAVCCELPARNLCCSQSQWAGMLAPFCCELPAGKLKPKHLTKAKPKSSGTPALPYESATSQKKYKKQHIKKDTTSHKRNSQPVGTPHASTPRLYCVICVCHRTENCRARKRCAQCSKRQGLCFNCLSNLMLEYDRVGLTCSGFVL